MLGLGTVCWWYMMHLGREWEGLVVLREWVVGAEGVLGWG